MILSLTKWLPNLMDQFTFWGGGKGKQSGGGAPTQQTVTQTNIPEYARPYVEQMLGKTSALTDLSQNPYQVYQGQRSAGFSPMQQQAFENVQNQQVAQQIGAGSSLAGSAGLASLGAGQQYAQMATDPNAMKSYMSPYIQNVLDTQKAEAIRDYQKNLQTQQAQAVGQGAYGGSRQAILEAEGARNLGTQLGNIEATGLQNAFQQAQQAQQFGANLGLQGAGQATQAAGAMGQLGQTQFGQQQAITQGLQQAGQQQQALAQEQLNQQYQNFLDQQNYPYKQIGFMSDVLHGLPLGQSTQSMYAQQPNIGSQVAGLGLAGLGLYNAMNKPS